MNATLWWLQTIVIAVIVVSALLAALRRLLPIPSRRWQALIVGLLAASPMMPARLRALVLRAQPKATTGTSCGDGCSTCGGCGVAAAAATNGDADARDDAARPLVFHRSASSLQK